MWPDSPGWQRSARCGPKGVSRGGGMNLAAGGFLGKLAQQGYVSYSAQPHGWLLTDKGRQVLALAREFADILKPEAKS